MVMAVVVVVVVAGLVVKAVEVSIVQVFAW